MKKLRSFREQGVTLTFPDRPALLVGIRFVQVLMALVKELIHLGFADGPIEELQFARRPCVLGRPKGTREVFVQLFTQILPDL